MTKFSVTKVVSAVLLTTLVISSFSCGEDEPDPKSSEKGITDFYISARGNTYNAVLQSDGKTLKFTVPYADDQEALKEATPTFKIPKGATSVPGNGRAQDFTKDVTYTVTAEDGSTAVYTVKKEDGKSSDARILTFKLFLPGLEENEGFLDGEIDNNASKVYFSPPQALWDNLTEAVPYFTLSPGATSNPATEVKQNFQEPVAYVVTANDGSTRTWTVERIQRTGKDVDYFYLDILEKPEEITIFEPAERTGETVRIIANINKETHEITYDMPALPEWFTPSSISNIYPIVIQISPGATVAPNWNVKVDFTKDVTYTVTAEDGTTQDWVVKAPKYYMKQKWYRDVLDLMPFGNGNGQTQGANSIGVIGDYLVLSRTPTLLIDKSTGTIAQGEWNIDGVGTVNSGNPPFFITNDDAGNLIGCTLSNWSGANWYLFKWSQVNVAPEVILTAPITGTPFGRKFTVVGNINESAKITASDMSQLAQGVQHVWSVTGGEFDDIAGTEIVTGVPSGGTYGYQVLTPINLTDNAPYYLGTNNVSNDGPFVNLQYGVTGSLTKIPGPHTGAAWSAEGYGNWQYFYQRLFSIGTDNFLVMFTGAYNGGYLVTIVQRHANGTHTTPIKGTIAWDQGNPDHGNGNGTGTLTLEKVGNDVLIYAFATGQAVVCYQMSALSAN